MIKKHFVSTSILLFHKINKHCDTFYLIYFMFKYNYTFNYSEIIPYNF